MTMYVTDFSCPKCGVERHQPCRHLHDPFRNHGWHYFHDARWRVLFKEQREIRARIKALQAEIRRLKKFVK